MGALISAPISARTVDVMNDLGANEEVAKELIVEGAEAAAVLAQEAAGGKLYAIAESAEGLVSAAFASGKHQMPEQGVKEVIYAKTFLVNGQPVRLEDAVAALAGVSDADIDKMVDRMSTSRKELGRASVEKLKRLGRKLAKDIKEGRKSAKARLVYVGQTVNDSASRDKYRDKAESARVLLEFLALWLRGEVTTVLVDVAHLPGGAFAANANAWELAAWAVFESSPDWATTNLVAGGLEVGRGRALVHAVSVAVREGTPLEQCPDEVRDACSAHGVAGPVELQAKWTSASATARVANVKRANPDMSEAQARSTAYASTQKALDQNHTPAQIRGVASMPVDQLVAALERERPKAVAGMSRGALRAAVDVAISRGTQLLHMPGGAQRDLAMRSVRGTQMNSSKAAAAAAPAAAAPAAAPPAAAPLAAAPPAAAAPAAAPPAAAPLAAAPLAAAAPAAAPPAAAAPAAAGALAAAGAAAEEGGSGRGGAGRKRQRDAVPVLQRELEELVNGTRKSVDVLPATALSILGGHTSYAKVGYVNGRNVPDSKKGAFRYVIDAGSTERLLDSEGAPNPGVHFVIQQQRDGEWVTYAHPKAGKKGAYKPCAPFRVPLPDLLDALGDTAKAKFMEGALACAGGAAPPRQKKTHADGHALLAAMLALAPAAPSAMAAPAGPAAAPAAAPSAPAAAPAAPAAAPAARAAPASSKGQRTLEWWLDGSPAAGRGG